MSGALVPLFLFYPYVLQGTVSRAADLLKEQRCEVQGGVWHSAQNRCEMSRLRRIKNGLEKFSLQVSEEDSVTVFNPPPESDRPQILSGEEDGVRVELFPEQIHLFAPFLFTAPFRVNFGGTGNFCHVGLFSDKDGVVRHLDSIFVGDRIPIQKMTSRRIHPGRFHYSLHIHYLERAEGESFVQQPTLEKILKVKVVHNQANESIHFEPDKSCEELEGRVTSFEGHNVCYFDDNRQCTLEALASGLCPNTGVKIADYSDAGEIFCAISGETPNLETQKCELSSGAICDFDSFLNGTCGGESGRNGDAAR